MSNNLKSLSEIFDNRVFRIPDYQQGYAWTKPQLEDFWDDLNNIISERYHYTGLLSVKQVSLRDYKHETAADWLVDQGYTLWHVVDGQQRLTTFVILLNEILYFLANVQDTKKLISDSEIEKYREKYIVKTNGKGPLKGYIFGYEEDNPSYLYLRHEVFGEPLSQQLEKTYYTKNLKEAKDYFKTEIKKLSSREDIGAIVSLLKNLTERLKFNIHEIDNDYDVYVAFETMNNRGKSLSNLEILKNRLIYLSTIYSNSQADEFEKQQLRDNINEAWKEIYKQIGRNVNHPLGDDDFLRAHWACYFKYSRETGDDYKNFLFDRFNSKNVVIKGDDQDFVSLSEIDEYVQHLKNFSKNWYYSFFPEESNKLSSEEIAWIKKLNRVEISHFRPLVATAIRCNVTEEAKICLYKSIERFIFVLFRLGNLRMSSYKSSEIYGYAHELYKNSASIETITSKLNFLVQEDLKNVSNAFKVWLEPSFKSRNGYYSWRPLRYFLYEYELYLTNKDEDLKMTWEEFTNESDTSKTIEHIYPQTANAYVWRKAFEIYNENDQRTLTNALGNLLALKQGKNSSLSNNSFAEKCNPTSGTRNGYAEGSFSEIKVSKYKEWNAKSIYKRSIEMLDFLNDRWNLNWSKEEIDELTFIQFANDPNYSSHRKLRQPHFRVPEGDMSSNVAEAKKQYWSVVLPALKRTFGPHGPFEKSSPSSSDTVSGWFNIGGVRLYCQIQNREERGVVGIVFETGNKELNLEMYNAIYKHTDDIKQKIPCEFEWNGNNDKYISCYFCTYLNGHNFMHIEDCQNLKHFHINTSKALLENIIEPYRAELIAIKEKYA